ncbi:FMN-linked oxidoreductase [Eremomyces bilateralis CBS 781.70]|uniref:FMN-linked oxidoreductase n=1 Tax=Eremomyces bilateralis CBS 781.70 TaxID=1392243 RepID=A0A6G1FR51_9PEZI|nr:FMN-linked oxidoreductase [Eremomyces bilateralis CBS 781.70]KAF1808208.1 FMN-linked oxidoreductase [Eremomyces bilateralis CBS 781.70]
MVRSGELPARLLALKYGADLVWGPETIDRSMIGTTRHVHPVSGCIEFRRKSSNVLDDPSAKESIIYRIDPAREAGKLIYQLGTAHPDTAVAAALLVAPDVSGIDVNSGCPKPFSTTGGMGAALLRDPDRLCAILTNLVEKVGIPHEIGISVKIRILATAEETRALVTRLVGTGITGLTVHCRTTPMRPRERAIRDQLRMVAEICREAGVACVMNGDVYSRGEAVALMEEFGADGAMIATAAEKDPSVFRKGGEPAEWREMVEFYMGEAIRVRNRWGNTKFTLAQIVPGKKVMDLGIAGTKRYRDVAEVLGFEHLIEAADRLDQDMGLTAPRVSRADRKAAAKAARKAEQGEDDESNQAKRIKLPETMPPEMPSVVNEIKRTEALLTM